MRVLLANDASAYSHAAADYLLAMPFRKPIDLNIVSAVMPPTLIDSGTMGMPAELSMFVTEEQDAVKARVEATAEQLEGPTHSIHTHVPIGSPSQELLVLADSTGADLIVLGAVGHSAVERVLLGSVSDYVATHADVTTLVVRPQRDSEVPPSLRKIVIACSGGRNDARMVEWLRCFKFDHAVEIHLVRILHLSTFYRQDVRAKASNYWISLAKVARRQLLELETTLQTMGLTTETHLIEAEHIGETLIDYAEEHGCDLIMTGDSDNGFLTRLVLGSTSRYVLRHATCSVLIVREKTEREATQQPGDRESQQVN